MGDEHKQAEWLLQADICRKMANRTNDPVFKVRWLSLARDWLMLGGGGADRETERFEAAVQDKGTGQKSSSSSN